MTAIIRPIFHYSIADSIYEKIQTQTASYYYYIGKINAWPNEEVDLVVPDPINTQSYENDSRNNMVTLKQVTINDVSMCVRRIDWASGVIYDQYDDTDVNLDSKNFYVLTTDFNVYKCLSNNYNSESTEQPSGQDLVAVKYDDDYVWKFMYSIPNILRNKFLIPSYMPVTRKAKNQYYTPGSIDPDNWVIVDGGSLYDPETTSATISGDGEGAAITLQIEDGVITGIVVTAVGEGYTNATLNIVKVSEEDPGSGGQVTIQVSSSGTIDTAQGDVETYAVDGELSSIIVTNGSNGYTEAPIVTITGDGTGAEATAIISDGSVVAINLTNRGSGYSYATVAIATEALLGGAFAAATARAITSPAGGHGFNAPKELFANTLCFYTSFTNVLNHDAIPISHDYRQFGIVSNIQTYGSLGKYSGVTAAAGYLLEGTFLAIEYPPDSFIYTADLSKNLQVVTALDNQMLVISIDGTVPEVDDVYTNANDYSFTLTDLTEPNINKFSGEMLFIDNQTAFESSEEQEISFRTFIKL